MSKILKMGHLPTHGLSLMIRGEILQVGFPTCERSVAPALERPSVALTEARPSTQGLGCNLCKPYNYGDIYIYTKL